MLVIAVETVTAPRLLLCNKTCSLEGEVSPGSLPRQPSSWDKFSFAWLQDAPVHGPSWSPVPGPTCLPHHPKRGQLELGGAPAGTQ